MRYPCKPYISKLQNRNQVLFEPYMINFINAEKFKVAASRLKTEHIVCFYYKVIFNKKIIWCLIRNSKMRVIHILRSNTRTFEWSIRHLAPQDGSNCVFHEKVVSPQKSIWYTIYDAEIGKVHNLQCKTWKWDVPRRGLAPCRHKPCVLQSSANSYTEITDVCYLDGIACLLSLGIQRYLAHKKPPPPL